MDVFINPGDASLSAKWTRNTRTSSLILINSPTGKQLISTAPCRKFMKS